MTIKANVTGTGNSAAAASAIVGGVVNVTAAGAGQSTATLLPRASNCFVNAGTGGVIMPPGVGTTQGLALGDYIRVHNQSGNSINVYPPTGGNIQGAGTNAAFAVGNNKVATIVMLTATLWGANLSA
jgi:hypothetical protein